MVIVALLNVFHISNSLAASCGIALWLGAYIASLRATTTLGGSGQRGLLVLSDHRSNPNLPRMSNFNSASRESPFVFMWMWTR